MAKRYFCRACIVPFCLTQFYIAFVSLQRLLPLLDNNTRWTSLAVMVARHIRLEIARDYIFLSDASRSKRLHDLPEADQLVVKEFLDPHRTSGEVIHSTLLYDHRFLAVHGFFLALDAPR